MALIVHVHDRLDLEHRTEQRRRCRYAPAALEVHQIIDREPVAEMRPRLHQIIIRLLDRRAGLLLLRREIDIQSFAERRAEAVDGQNFALRILLAQLVRRDAAD